MKLTELGEFELIEQIRHRATQNSAGVHRGIGDDAAELILPEGHHLLTSTDLLIENIHFRHDWTDCESLGHKAVAVNLSDIAAMGGRPRYLYLGLACPGETDTKDLEAFLKGALQEAQRHKVTLVGGDTCRSPGPWLISVTVEGSVQAKQSIGRNNAQPGDRIMVSGNVGDSALALDLLHSGKEPDRTLQARHHRPTARVDLGEHLGQNCLANAMIDISDGLAGDLEHILQASEVDGIINAAEIPLSDTLLNHAGRELALEKFALYGGEDYELLFTVAPENEAQTFALGRELGVPITSIGVIQKGPGRLFLLDDKGKTNALPVRGYNHFHPV